MVSVCDENRKSAAKRLQTFCWRRRRDLKCPRGRVIQCLLMPQSVENTDFFRNSKIILCYRVTTGFIVLGVQKVVGHDRNFEAAAEFPLRLLFV